MLAATARAEPVLHEYVPNVEPGEATPVAAGRPGRGNAPGASTTAPAEANGDSADSNADEPAYEATAGDGSPGEPPGRRSQTFRPDRLTELADGLDYYEVFRPSIAPFKRVTSLGLIQLDADGKTPVLAVRDQPRIPVPIEGESSRPPDGRPRDRFTADVRLDFRDGPVVPLPSVSPESRILSFRTTPAVPLRIERDADDNFAVRLVGSAPRGPIEVALVTDAPRSYFGTEIPNGRVNALEAEVPRLERSIESRALAMARRMKLSKKSDLRTALETLTHYFRAFEESKEPPENTGDMYLDLVRSQKGICRHRAYGFVVTAQALGIPARFVQNEAHSWVEVKLPRVGYMRIDLGGAADGLTAHNASDAPSYVPAQPDPLPQPASYRRSYAQAAARARGPAPTSESITGRWLNPGSVQQQPAAEADTSSGRTQPSASDTATAAQGDTSGASESSTRGAARDAAARLGLAAASPAAAASGTTDARGQPRAPRTPLVIRLHERERTALRGSELTLSGRVLDQAARGIAGVRVEVWIASQPRNERMLLGVCVTDGSGDFHAALGVPPDLQVGDYRLLVLTPGDSQYSAAVAP